MLCKLASGDIITEGLTWRSIGTPGPTGPLSQPSQTQGQSASDLRSNTSELANAASDSTDERALKQRIIELESSRNIDVEQARQAGIEQGLRQARSEAAAEMEAALDRLAQSVQDVAHVKRRVRAEAENELVKLSLSIAKRILHRELTTDPQSLRGIVYAALQHLQNREITRVRVFPAGVSVVRAALERNGGVAAIEIIPDVQMQPGALVFETSVGELDASVETQLQEIERGFVDRLQLR